MTCFVCLRSWEQNPEPCVHRAGTLPLSCVASPKLFEQGSLVLPVFHEYGSSRSDGHGKKLGYHPKDSYMFILFKTPLTGWG